MLQWGRRDYNGPRRVKQAPIAFQMRSETIGNFLGHQMTESTKNPGQIPHFDRRVDRSAYPANAELIEILCEAILERAVGSPQFLSEYDGQESIYYWASRFVNSDEFRRSFLRKHGLPTRDINFVRDSEYRIPSLLPLKRPTHVFLTGSCLMDGWVEVLAHHHENTNFTRQIFNNASELEDVSAQELSGVDFQIVQIPLRSLISEAEYFSLSVSQNDRLQLEKAFEDSVLRMKQHLDSALKYNRQMGMLTFVMNFGRPQANALGFMQPKYEFSNFSHYVYELNRSLYEMVTKETSVYMIDFDEIAATMGKRFILDDISSHSNHGSFIGGTPSLDSNSFTPLGDPDAIYGAAKQEITLAIYNECVASFNVLRSDNKIKIVIFDLDGTLWRGVPADTDDLGGHLTEGWPLSLLEAAAFLKKRGILLAIASKNDPEVATKIWNSVYGRIFPLSNFATTRFTWNSKVDSVAQILAETNLSAQNCLFVDDNPVERERVQLAFPDIRVLQGPIFTWRRALLWGVELQASNISDESVHRTSSTQAMIDRNALKSMHDEVEFAAQLAVRVRLNEIVSQRDRRFSRALELLNKTNQFNTTGRRWTEQEVRSYFEEGGRFVVAHVEDRLSTYGLTAVMLKNKAECTQLVMSCRVFGLDVEYALLEHFMAQAASDRQILFRSTGRNALCRLFLDKAGLALPAVDIFDQFHTILVPYDFKIAKKSNLSVTYEPTSE